MRKVMLFIVVIAGFQSIPAFGEIWKYYIPGNDIRGMAVWGDSVWCVTSGSVVRWSQRDGSHVQYTVRDGIPVDDMGNVEQVVIDRTGVPWFACCNTDFFICRFEGATSDIYKSTEYDIPNAHFTSSFRDSRGNLWFGSRGDGVGRFDGSVWNTFRPPETLANTRAIGRDSRGVVWLASICLWSFDGKIWKHYATGDGPAGLGVRCIAPDDNGAVWFGTAKGVFRFDGNAWMNYTTSDGLASNDVTVIVTDRKGGIWVGTNGGVSHFDGAVWKSFREEDHLISKKVTGIAIAADGNLWFSHGKGEMGVTVYDGENLAWCTIFNTSIPTNDVRIVTSGSDGVIWCVIEDGVMSWDGKEWRKYGVSDGLKSPNVSGISIDALNRAWFLYAPSAQAGVTCFDGVAWKTYTKAEGLRSDIVNSVSVREDGVMWFAGPEGASLFDGVTWDYFPKNDRLFSKVINSITEDSTGVMWFATDGGLTRFDGASWRTYTSAEGLPEESVTTVQAASDGSLWLICKGTLINFNGIAFRPYPISVDAGLPSGFTYDISGIALDKQGTLWTNTLRRLPDVEGKAAYGGVWCLKDGQWVEKTNPVPDGNVNKMMIDDTGSLLLATSTGLIRYDGISVWEYRIDGPTRDYYDSYVCDNENRMWFIFSTDEYHKDENQRISYFNADCFDGKSWRRFTKEIGNEKSLNFHILSIEKDNTIWFSSGEGIYTFDGFTITQVLSRLTYPINDTVSTFAQDTYGIFWVMFTTYDTLYRYDGKTWTTLSEADGLISNKATRVIKDSNGIIWAQTDKGVSCYDGYEWKSIQISNGSIFHFGEDNSIWFRTPDGIIRYDEKQWKVMLGRENYPSNMDNFLGVDNDNHIWVSTQEGFSRYDGTMWKTYTTADGFFQPYTNFFVVDKNNIKWFKTIDGFCTLDDRPNAGSDVTPKPLTLRGNYPNPFNAGTSIEFDLYSWGRVDLSIYNITGQKVRSLDLGKMESGRHSVPWSGVDDRGKRVSSGPYFYRIKNEGRMENGRMMMVK